jgi:hypothetical protein
MGGALLAAGVAAAAPTARLVYSRASDAESCPAEGSLRRAVAERVGYDPFFAWAQRTVVANIARHKGEFVATVDLVDERGIAHGAHELRTNRGCGELLDAVALAIAIAIDPQSLTRAPDSTPKPQGESNAPDAVVLSPPATSASLAPSAPPEASVQPVPPSRLPSRAGIAFEPSIGIVVSNGVAPSVAAGASAGAAVRWRAFSLGIEGRIDAPASKTVPGGDVSSWLMLGAVVPCAYVGPFLGCALFQVGSMQAQGDVPDGRHDSSGWWALGGRVGALVHVAENGLLRVRVDLLANLSRTPLQLNPALLPPWTPDPVNASLGVDALWRFQ